MSLDKRWRAQECYKQASVLAPNAETRYETARSSSYGDQDEQTVRYRPVSSASTVLWQPGSSNNESTYLVRPGAPSRTSAASSSLNNERQSTSQGNNMPGDAATWNQPGDGIGGVESPPRASGGDYSLTQYRQSPPHPQALENSGASPTYPLEQLAPRD